MKRKKSTKKIKKNQTDKLKKMLEISYGADNTDPSLIRDEKLSGKRVSVLTDTNDAKTYVIHRGTSGLKDWFTDFQMALGYENGRRFTHSKKIQQKAEAKYGSSNVVTVGHSLGGRLAEKFGKNSSNIVTFNKAVTPRSIFESYINPLSKKQYDIRTERDPISAASKLQGRKNDVIKLESNTINPLTEHSLKTLTKPVQQL